MYFHVITAIGTVWAVGTLEGLVACVRDHVVLEVLTFIPPADYLPTHWTQNRLPTASRAHACLQRQGTASARPFLPKGLHVNSKHKVLVTSLSSLVILSITGTSLAFYNLQSSSMP